MCRRVAAPGCRAPIAGCPEMTAALRRVARPSFFGCHHADAALSGRVVSSGTLARLMQSHESWHPTPRCKTLALCSARRGLCSTTFGLCNTNSGLCSATVVLCSRTRARCSKTVVLRRKSFEPCSARVGPTIGTRRSGAAGGGCDRGFLRENGGCGVSGRGWGGGSVRFVTIFPNSRALAQVASRGRRCTLRRDRGACAPLREPRLNVRQ